MMTDDVLMPVAVDAVGALLRVEDSDNGLMAGASCLCCGVPVVAKQGEFNSWHFAHHGEFSYSAQSPSHTTDMGISTCSLESYLHKAGKRLLLQSITDALSEKRPLPMRWDNDCFHKYHEAENILPSAATHVEEERLWGELRPDLAIMAGGRPLYFAEIVVTHSPESNVYSVRHTRRRVQVAEPP